MRKFSLILLTAIAVFLLQSVAECPTMPYYYMKVRLTCYSPKQPRESSKTALGTCAKNEYGVAVPKGFLPFGTKIVLPNGDDRIVDDRTSRWAGKKFGGKLVDIRYYTTIKSKPKSRSVKKELRKLDMGYGIIRVYFQ